MKIATRDELKKLAASIENLAREIQLGMNNVLNTANELVHNNMVLVFALGEISATGSTPVKVIQSRYQNYHNKRDTSTGKFLRK